MSHDKSCCCPCISISHLYRWIQEHALLKEEHDALVASSLWCEFMVEVFGLCMHGCMGQDHCLDINMHSWTVQPHRSTCMMVITVSRYKLSGHKEWDSFILLPSWHIVLRTVNPSWSTIDFIHIVDGNLCFTFRTWIGWALHVLSHHTSMIASSLHGVIHRSCFVVQSQQCQNPWQISTLSLLWSWSKQDTGSRSFLEQRQRGGGM